MWSDVKDFVRRCEVCQRTNDSKFIKSDATLHPIPVKSKVWDMVSDNYFMICHCCSYVILQVGIDLVGPLPRTAKGNRYIVTLVDYFSKWPEAEAVTNKSANSVALFLYKMMCR